MKQSDQTAPLQCFHTNSESKQAESIKTSINGEGQRPAACWYICSKPQLKSIISRRFLTLSQIDRQCNTVYTVLPRAVWSTMRVIACIIYVCFTHWIAVTKNRSNSYLSFLVFRSQASLKTNTVQALKTSSTQMRYVRMCHWFQAFARSEHSND